MSYLDRIDAYLSGGMSDEERNTFEHDLQNDKALCNEAEPVLLLAQVMREERIKRDERFIAAVRARVLARRRFRIRVWAGAIAAVFIFVFLLPSYFFKRSTQDAFSYYYTPSLASGVMRGDENQGLTEKDELAALFDRVGTDKDMTDVIDKLETIKEKTPSDSVSWYLALAYLKDRQINSALPLLESITSNTELEKPAGQLLDRLNNQNFIVRWGKRLDDLF